MFLNDFWDCSWIFRCFIEFEMIHEFKIVHEFWYIFWNLRLFMNFQIVYIFLIFLISFITIFFFGFSDFLRKTAWKWNAEEKPGQTFLVRCRARLPLSMYDFTLDRAPMWHNRAEISQFLQFIGRNFLDCGALSSVRPSVERGSQALQLAKRVWPAFYSTFHFQAVCRGLYLYLVLK